MFVIFLEMEDVSEESNTVVMELMAADESTAVSVATVLYYSFPLLNRK